MAVFGWMNYCIHQNGWRALKKDSTFRARNEALISFK
jgi:hypothetical protein